MTIFTVSQVVDGESVVVYSFRYAERCRAAILADMEEIGVDNGKRCVVECWDLHAIVNRNQQLRVETFGMIWVVEAVTLDETEV